MTMIKRDPSFQLQKHLSSNWAYALVIWGLISIALSYLIQRYFKKNDDKKDINTY